MMSIFAMPLSSSPLKRTYSDTERQTLNFEDTATAMAAPASPSRLSSNLHYTQHSSDAVDQLNPGILTSQSLSRPATPSPAALASPLISDQPKKRTKLTSAEKEVKRFEKEEKEKQKAEQKAKRDEERVRKEQEKARKDEEKKAKDVEKEEKRRAKEDQNRQREEEKLKREEEKDKKAKSQLRLNAFFGPPRRSVNESSPPPTHGTPSPMMSRRGSVVSSNGDRSTPAPAQTTTVSDYEKLFPPFFLQSHTTVAPSDRFFRDQEALHFTQRKIDREIVQNESACSAGGPFNATGLLRLSPFKRRRLYGPEPNVKEIIERIHGTFSNPIDLTDNQMSRKASNPRELLKSVSTRYLKFAEDVRPPYIGTFTRRQDLHSRMKLSRNPFSRSLPATDYDYDSEIEWEEPEEGEDLESEGEEEIDEEEPDEMEGFLDDTEATDGVKPSLKRRLIVGNLEPVCTGLCWEGTETSRALASYRIEAILDDPRLPIDPYSVSYWHDTATLSSNQAITSHLLHPSAQSPRRPLNPTSDNVLFGSFASASTSDAAKPNHMHLNANAASVPSRALKVPKRLVGADVMEDFKRAVQGSDLTKAGLVEILKKQFPKQSKDAIKDTLGLIADRMGGKEKDKRWVLKTGDGSEP